MKSISALVVWLLLPLATFAQLHKDPTAWSASLAKQPAKVGDVVTVQIQASISGDWHIYSNDLNPDIGPLPTTFKFKPSDGLQRMGDPVPVGVEEAYEEVWKSKIRQFSGKALFLQKVKVLKPNAVFEGTVEYMACSSKDGTCLPPAEAEFSVAITTAGSEAAKPPVVADASTPKATSAVTEGAAQPGATTIPPADTVASAPAGQTIDSTVARAVSAPVQTLNETATEADGSLWGFIVAAFLSGLVALLTPCVFPIIPATVSFFTNQQGGQWKALLYGVFIVAIYVLIGTVVSRFNGPAFANFVSTHWLPNVLFFATFFIFGLSFLGLFEIVLPNALINKADAQSEKGGIAGIFFMAFTLVLVSFSCTGPIVGSLLVASAGGEIIKPIIGMAAFSSAFAIPFTLFAAFPHWLKSLPKSGGWLNSVKVVLGFLEIALALKFLSVADQVYHWNLLDREVFLSLWIVIFALIGFYFLGKIRLPHDSETKVVSVPRLLMAIATFAFVVYMVPGLWGAPLKALSGYLPPETSQDFSLHNSTASTEIIENPLGEQPKYADLFHFPRGLQGFFDYNQAMAYAKKVNKPVFIDFTGWGCVNCREMEARVWSDPAVMSRLQKDFVMLALYVDDKTELPEADWYTSVYDGKVKKSIGAQNADLQITKYNANAQPHYCIVGSDGKLLVAPKNYDRSVENFVTFLDTGKGKFIP
ncbi:cytochrome c biogenesis protein CcdA [Spirosoma utsteinense]|uniref:Thiol:disulfide interchange protein DsbD n=1 Tax=Spirosoma utsteinense TaxID=2585773 RepID=A0ABR6W988_9BACT|nr:cytochrome c biogenesis protein CcdA [Spirosoma utsteinense]MBC3784916.1 thiol:disulfide interchange protein DsbD [Spirosoma utsteinense]MBC3792477.1 thiol:disulfide interchange protein DsbD [Spirosoma utsteinense]